MFLLEYKKGNFANAEYIDWVEIVDGRIKFTINGEEYSIYIVDSDCKDLFLNHLNAINKNGKTIHDQDKK